MTKDEETHIFCPECHMKLALNADGSIPRHWPGTSAWDRTKEGCLLALDQDAEVAVIKKQAKSTRGKKKAA